MPDAAVPSAGRKKTWRGVLTRRFVYCMLASVPTAERTVDVVRGARRAATLLQHPMRLRLLRALHEPDSATGLSRRLGTPRQLVNYHLRELERAGFVELEEERPRRGMTERVMRATATSLVISPEALEELGADPAQMKDRFSWAYLVAAAAKVIRELGILRERADAVKKQLPTMTIESEICFASATQRDAFAEDLQQTLLRLATKYHNEHASGARRFRVVVGAYPAITKSDEEAQAEADAARRAELAVPTDTETTGRRPTPGRSTHD